LGAFIFTQRLRQLLFPQQSGRYQYLEGCISGLCLCPIQLTTQLEGKMRLIRDGDDAFDVRDVSWDVLCDSAPLHFTGEGRYVRRGTGESREHRMELALSANGREAVPYDSGWMPLSLDGYDIDLYLPMAEVVCYGSAFGVRAVAASPVPTDHQSWGTVKLRW
jgi:hypothetical protein